MRHMNSWQAAFTALGQAAAIIIVMLLISTALSYGLRMIFRRSNDQWRELRVRRFWVINSLSAPISLGLYALIARILGLNAAQIGFNANQLGLSLAVSLPLALLLGGTSAWAAHAGALQGLNPLNVPFASKADVIGSIAYMVILVGPLEEIPFRGILQTVLQQGLPQAAHLGPITLSLGAFLAALIFVLYHVRNVFVGGESLTRFAMMIPGRLVLSLIMAILFEQTGSLIGPIVFHNLVDTCTITSLATTIYNLRQQGKWPPVSASATETAHV